MSDPMVSTSWLNDRLGEADLRVLDASWHMPGSGRDAAREFEAGHIPTAAFFDIDAIADATSPLPHMLPTADAFADAVARLGVGDEHEVVVYDCHGLMSAARVWWEFRAFGHDRVRVLDGGLPKWRAEERPLQTGPATPAPARFTARPNTALVRDFDQVAQALQTRGAQLVDARAAPRFRGEAPEPRAGLRSGHMPGALNLPFGELVAGDGRLKAAAELSAIFTQAGVDLHRPATATCGSGITAAVLALALARLGRWDAAVYDGSWAEWGGRDDAPVVTGPA